MEHIVKSFDAELARLHDAVLRMGVLACSQFDQAVQAVVSGDTALAATVAAGDEAVDALEEAINAQVIRLLALRAPLAEDLRTTVTAIKIANALERTGDYAASMAKRSLLLHGQTKIRPVATLQRMGFLVHGMITDVLDAYRDRDAAKAQSVWARDREVDELHSSLFRELLTYMMEDPGTIGACTHLLFIAKNIERVGDHATNIGEMVCFMVSGHTIAGERPKADLGGSPPPGLDPRAHEARQK